jgi:hypothetical protein
LEFENYGKYCLKFLFVTLGIMRELLFKTLVWGFGNYGELLCKNLYFWDLKIIENPFGILWSILRRKLYLKMFVKYF